MSTGQRTIGSTRGILRLQMDEEMAHNEDYEEETRTALYEYVFRRATEDNALTGPQARTFQNVEHQAGGGRSQAATVGRRLAELGDEIDAQYYDEMEELVQLTGSPDSAFSMFNDIVKHLFEWDESGGAKISVGRIAALLAYCYHMAKTYLQQRMTAYGLLSFLGVVASWLVKFLLKAKFYGWLEKQGGWGQLISSTTSGWGNHVFLAIGVASLAIWAFSYFRSK